MYQHDSEATCEVIRRECDAQLDAASLPSGLLNTLAERQILFGEHPHVLIMLPLVMYRALGGTHVADTAPAGAAIEFLLAAADVLDDVQDGAVAGADAGGHDLHSRYVSDIELVTALLLLGEQSMISLIGKSIASDRITRAISIFNTFKMRAFSGQYSDVHREPGSDYSMDTSLMIVRGKSGNLGRCAAEIGAALAKSDDRQIELAGQFGENLAVARQFHDDAANLWPGTGSLEDLAQSKATLPLTYAVHNGVGSESVLKKLVAVRDDDHRPASDLEGEGVLRARDDVFSSGGIHFALLQSVIHIVKARSVGRKIEKLPPGEGLLEQLASV